MRGSNHHAFVLFMPAYEPPVGATVKNYYLGGLSASNRLRRGLGFLWLIWSLIHALPAV